MTNTIFTLMLIAGMAMSNPNERIADAHYSQRNIPQAIHHYTEALREDPDNAVLYYKRARAYLINHQYEAYNQDIRMALDIDPNLARKLPTSELIDDRNSMKSDE